MKLFVKKRTIILMILFSVLGFYAAYHIFSPAKGDKSPWTLPNVTNTGKKFITKDTLVSEIREKQDLITMEVDMAEQVVIDNSFGNLSIFKKVQSVNFFGKGLYTVDLSVLKSENLVIADNEKSITVKIPQPVIKTISLDEEKTTYKNPENGLFRFGEIKLTSSENQIMSQLVKEKMSKKMMEPALYDNASKTTELIIKGLIETITKGKTKTKYEITIEYEKRP
jgi:hypothetical protein